MLSFDGRVINLVGKQKISTNNMYERPNLNFGVLISVGANGNLDIDRAFSFVVSYAYAQLVLERLPKRQTRQEEVH